MEVWDYIRAIAAIIVVIVAAYYVTGLVARTGGPIRKGTCLKSRGSLPLGKDKSVALVEIGAQVYVLGVSAQRVELLDKLPGDTLGPEPEQPASRSSFSSEFQAELNRRLGRLRK